MKVLAIDPGTRYCGYAFLEENKGKTMLIEASVLKLKPTLPLAERIYSIYSFFHGKIEDCPGLTHLALETPFCGKNTQSFLKLGYVRGLLYLLSQQFDVKLLEYPPTVIKQAITSWGGAPKEQVATVIYKLFPTLTTGLRDDITDAIAIGLTALWKN